MRRRGKNYITLKVNRSRMIATMQIIDFNLNVECMSFDGVFYETI